MDATRRKAIHDAMVRLSDGDRTAFEVLVDELWPVILCAAATHAKHVFHLATLALDEKKARDQAGPIQE